MDCSTLLKSICDALSIFPFPSSLQLAIANPIFHVPIMKVEVFYSLFFRVLCTFFNMSLSVVYPKRFSDINVILQYEKVLSKVVVV